MSKLNLNELAEQIKTEHTAVTTAMKASLEHAILAGEYLNKVSCETPYKEFIQWAHKECKVSEATVNNYTRLYRHRHDLPKNLNYTEALKTLRRSRKTKTEAPVKTLTAWQTTIKAAMDKYRIKGNIDDVAAFLESFGVQEPCVAVKEAA